MKTPALLYFVQPEFILSFMSAIMEKTGSHQFDRKCRSNEPLAFMMRESRLVTAPAAPSSWGQSRWLLPTLLALYLLFAHGCHKEEDDDMVKAGALPWVRASAEIHSIG
jgi:hypothetical protein